MNETTECQCETITTHRCDVPREPLVPVLWVPTDRRVGAGPWRWDQLWVTPECALDILSWEGNCARRV